MPGYGLVAGVTGAGVWPGVSGGEGFDHEHHPEALEAEVSLPTATTRLTCSVAATTATPPPTRVSDDDKNCWASFRDTSLNTYEALELLTPGEVVSRKAHDSQLIGIHAALRGGASWEQIPEALGVPPDFTR